MSLGWVKDEIVRVCNNPMQQLSYVGASLDVLVIIIVVFRKPYLLLCVSELTGAIFFQFAKCYYLISKCISSICKICLFNLQNVFVQFAKCVCPSPCPGCSIGSIRLSDVSLDLWLSHPWCKCHTGQPHHLHQGGHEAKVCWDHFLQALTIEARNNIF